MNSLGYKNSFLFSNRCKFKSKCSQDFSKYFKLLRIRGSWDRFHQRKLFFEGSKDGPAMKEFLLKFRFLKDEAKLESDGSQGHQGIVSGTERGNQGVPVELAVTHEKVLESKVARASQGVLGSSKGGGQIFWKRAFLREVFRRRLRLVWRCLIDVLLR